MINCQDHCHKTFWTSTHHDPISKCDAIEICKIKGLFIQINVIEPDSIKFNVLHCAHVTKLQ